MQETIPFNSSSFSVPSYPPNGTLSVCMIVKNEENNIEDCINCVKPCADEIIVVDTGSTDNTVKLCEKHGVRVIPFEWCDSFSAARNESIKNATGDLIMWFDADDRIGTEEANLLARLKKVSPMDVVYGFRIISRSEDGESPPFMQMRLFPRHPQIRFENRVHESIGKSVVDLGLKVEYTDLEVVHMGYHNNKAIKEKMMRNIRLIKLDLQDNPKNTAHRYQLAQTYGALGQVRESIEELKKIMAIPEEKQIQRFVYEHTPAEIANKYYSLGNIEESLKWSEKALSLNDKNIVAMFLKAEIMFLKNEKAGARKIFLEITNTDFMPNSLPIDIQFYKNRAKIRAEEIQLS